MRLIALAFCLALLPAAVSAAERGVDAGFFASGGPLDQLGTTALETGAASSASPRPDILDSSDGMMGSALKVLAALTVVTLLILGLYRFLRRVPFSFAQNGLVRQITAEPLGPNQFLRVVEVGGKVIVFATTDKGITKLTELDGEAADLVRMWKPAGEDGKRGERPFSQFLRSWGVCPERMAGDEASWDASGERLERESERLRRMTL